MSKLIGCALLVSAGVIAGLAGCEACDDAARDGDSELSLHALADFPVGVAVPAGSRPNSLLVSPERQALVERHFSSITAENIMKMGYLQPRQGRFTFEHSDALVAYASQRGMLVHGHALVWHRQTPAWMDQHVGGRDEFIEILERHIRTVAGHFAGRVESWDVVNEAFVGRERTEYRETIWYDRIGAEYIELAFRTAREADPAADLYYNDFDISGAYGPEKLNRILEMVDDFLARGVPIDGVGFQMHIDMDEPELEDVRESFAKVATRGIKVRISELDVSLNESRQFLGLDPALAELQRRRYADIVRLYREEVPEKLRGGITVWGITDGDSWVPAFRNRPDWPLLFDAEFNAKPALRGMAEGLTDCRVESISTRAPR
jgi:endo-1,4-beta-xylanase